MKQDQEVRKLAGIEIPITALTNKFSFPNNNFLNGKTITAIWIPDNVGDDVLAPSGNSAVTNAVIFASNITIRKDSDAKVLEVQLSYFLESWSGGDRRVRELWIPGFNPGTTFINIPDITVLTVGTSYVLMVEYIDC